MIESSQVSITEATVSVKVVMVGKKQMTISVFNQLFCADPCAGHRDVENILRTKYEDGTLFGVVYYKDVWWLVWHNGRSIFKFDATQLDLEDGTVGEGVSESQYEAERERTKKVYAFIGTLDQLFIAV
jgi:hypothetical protein